MAAVDAGGILFLSKDMAHQRVYTANDKRDLHFLDVATDQNKDIWVISLTSGLLKLDEQTETFKPAWDAFPGADTLSNKIVEILSLIHI